MHAPCTCVLRANGTRAVGSRQHKPCVVVSRLSVSDTQSAFCGAEPLCEESLSSPLPCRLANGADNLVTRFNIRGTRIHDISVTEQEQVRSMGAWLV